MYLHDTDDVVRRPARTGLPVVRHSGGPPCATPYDDSDRCPKIPSDAPIISVEYAIELSSQNARAVNHYLECRAVNRWPEDWIVSRNARIIRAIYEQHESFGMNKLLSLFKRVEK